MNFKDLSAVRPDLAFIAHWVPNNATPAALRATGSSIARSPSRT